MPIGEVIPQTPAPKAKVTAIPYGQSSALQARVQPHQTCPDSFIFLPGYRLLAPHQTQISPKDTHRSDTEQTRSLRWV